MFELEAVINVEYGGFSLSDEMALWLVENKKWKLLSNKEYDYKLKYPIETLLDLFKDMHIHPHMNDEIEFRSNKDLIECVRHFKALHKNDEYPESYYGKIHTLRIEKIKINVEIDDYYDGKERIVSSVFVDNSYNNDDNDDE
jgi:hypothetical protein